jgi:tetratricopeptide (TPR) repeat protein
MEAEMKNESSKYVYDSGFSTFGLKYMFCIYCLMLLPFDLLTFVTGTVSADSDGLIEYELPEVGPVDPNESGSQLRLKLWKSDINAVKGEDDQKLKSELDRLIKQVRAVEITPQQAPETAVATKIEPQTEPNKVSLNITVPSKEKEDVKEKEIESRPPNTSLAEKTLQIIRGLLQNPEKIDNPFELGETLFVNGNLKEAAVFYQEALMSMDPNDTDSAADRAWLLFQIGNCLRNDDMTEAAKMYRQLITEYPNSLWAELAKVQSQFIAWYQTDEPQTLIAEDGQ